MSFWFVKRLKRQILQNVRCEPGFTCVFGLVSAVSGGNPKTAVGYNRHDYLLLDFTRLWRKRSRAVVLLCSTKTSGIQAPPSSRSTLAKVWGCPRGQEGGLWNGTWHHDYHNLIRWSFTARSHPERSCQTKVGWQLVFINKVLFEPGNPHSFMDCLWLLWLQWQHWVVTTEAVWPTEPYGFTLWLSEETVRQPLIQ